MVFMKILKKENIQEQFKRLSNSPEKAYMQNAIKAEKVVTKEERWNKISPMVEEKRGLNDKNNPV